MGARIRIAIAVTVVAAFATTAVAMADFTPAETISDPGRSSGYPAITAAGDGTATIAWTAGTPSSSRAEARRVAPGGGLGPILTLSQPGADTPVDAGTDAGGTTTVVWARNGIEFARISPAGVAEAPTPVTSDSDDGETIRPKAGVAPDGTTYLTWERAGFQRSRLEMAIVSPAGEVGPVQRLGAGRGISTPNIGVDGRGRATIVWRVFRERKKLRIVVGARVNRSGNIRKLGRISGRSGRNAGERIAVSRSGQAMVVWRHYGGRPSIQSAKISTRGKVRPKRVLAKGSFKRRYPYFTDPAVAYDPAGRAHAAWVRNDRNAGGLVFSAPLNRKGRARRALPISKPDRRASDVELAVDTDGLATLVWDGFDDGNEAQLATQRPRHGQPAEPQRLSDPGVTALRGQVAITGDEQPVITWWTLGSPSEVQLARGE